MWRLALHREGCLIRFAPRGLAAFVTGCNAFFGLTPTGVYDGSVPLDARMCSQDEPFTRTENVPIDGTYSVEAARFNPERSLAYLSLCPSNGNKTECELYTSPFSVATGEFTAFSKIEGVNDPDDYDSYPTITGDAQYLIFGSERTTPVNIWIATKANGTFAGSTPVRLDLVATAQHSNEPYVLPSALFATILYGDFEWDDAKPEANVAGRSERDLPRPLRRALFVDERPVRPRRHQKSERSYV
jgi:hypothetical protein